MTTRAAILFALALLGAVVTFAAAASGRSTRPAVATPCASHVRSGGLPVWRRGGFGPDPRTTYVLGRRGAIGGVLWGVRALDSPPAKDRHNKVLWVPRHVSKSVAPLWIRMQKMDGVQPVGAPVRRVIRTGPGPSYVDAPSSGCWRLTLSWSGRRDSLDLVYVAPPG